MDKADIILVVIDRSRPLSDEDKAILEDTKDKNVLVVLNKTDLMPVVTEKIWQAMVIPSSPCRLVRVTA